MSRRGFSPLEVTALTGLLSLIRDREPDRDFWTTTDIPLSKLYEATLRYDDRSYELALRSHRQAMRRALERLHPDFVFAIALGWVMVQDEAVLWWEGGGSRKTDPSGFRYSVPRWKLVGLTPEGIAVAEALERERGES